MTHTVTRDVRPARFLCRAAWRCATCDTHWTAVETRAKAEEAAREHDRAVHGVRP